MSPALAVEVRKALAARAVRWTLVVFVGGTTLLSLAFALAVRSGDARTIAKLGASGATAGWPGLVSGATQIAAAGSLLACGVIASWIVGREFADGTVGGLFALAVGRTRVAGAKLVVVLACALSGAVLLAAGVLIDGLLLGLGPPSSADALAVLRLVLLVAAAGPLVVPCAWAATASRGLLAGIGLAVGLLAGTQVLVVLGAGSWFPWAAPALWSLDPASVTWTVLLGPIVVGGLGWVACARAWTRLQLDR